SVGRLRRAFVAGDLYRSHGQTLARLSRERTSEATELKRHDLSPAELQEILAAMKDRLKSLQGSLETDSAVTLRRVPVDVDLRARVRSFLDQPGIGTLSPAIRAKP